MPYHSTLWFSNADKSRHFFCNATFCCWIRFVTSSRHVGTLSDIIITEMVLMSWEYYYLEWNGSRMNLLESQIGYTEKVSWKWVMLMSLNLSFGLYTMLCIYESLQWICLFLSDGSLWSQYGDEKLFSFLCLTNK